MTVHVISAGLSILDAPEEPRRTFRDMSGVAAAVRKEAPGQPLEVAGDHGGDDRADRLTARAPVLAVGPVMALRSHDDGEMVARRRAQWRGRR